MITKEKSEFKDDEVFNYIYEQIKKRHIIPQHTRDNLISKSSIENICESTKHFAHLTVKSVDFYISYETDTWVREREQDFLFPVRFSTITLYDSMIEYNTCRIKELGAATNGGFIPHELMN